MRISILITGEPALQPGIPGIASAQPVAPHRFNGQASIDGQAARAGVEVAAFVDGQRVASATVTDDSGAYTLLVDQPSGNRTITFQVNGLNARETATWTQGAISYPFNLNVGGVYSPDQVFAPLISDSSLVVVWHYDNATQTWSSFSPCVPAEINDLTLVNTGDIVWIQLAADREFQGQRLREGWSLIVVR